ncbi:type IX secretion system membrane protein PorP/SprF [Flavobacteriales bacterium]|nr:type IX secretion system membrane protein PorP/SprF [Flavobacteriales bacterium]
MGNFEDEIRKKLHEGEMEINASHWDQFNNKLSSEPSYSSFETSLKDKLNAGSAAIPAGSWNNFNNNFNNTSKFDKALKNKLDDEVQLDSTSWESFNEKLAESNLSKFERIIGSRLKSGNIQYNSKHWQAIEKILNRKSRNAYLKIAAAIALLFGLSFGIWNTNDEKKSLFVDHLNESFIKKKSNSKKVIKKEVKSALLSENNNLTSRLSTKGNSDLFDSKKGSNLTISAKIRSQSLNQIGHKKDNTIQQSNIIVDKKVFKANIISIDCKKIEVCPTPLNLPSKIIYAANKPAKSKLHAGATVWLNFWDNSSLTGFYNNQNLSASFYNQWETVYDYENKAGIFNFIQPQNFLVGYESQIKKSNFAIGGYLTHLIQNNWNNREANLSLSYKNKFSKKVDVRIGANASYHKDNLAVNQLTLREKAINSDYIFTTALGSLKARSKQYLNYDLSGFINHPSFYVGYNADNLKSTRLDDETTSQIIKHSVISGIHLPEVKKLKSSLLFKYEKEIFHTYTPGIGITYNDKIFVMSEYEALKKYSLTLGCYLLKGLKFQGRYSIRQLESNQIERININNYTERKGYVSFGINYAFK